MTDRPTPTEPRILDAVVAELAYWADEFDHRATNRYPKDVFPIPLDGEPHSTPDGAAAAMARHVYRIAARELNGRAAALMGPRADPPRQPATAAATPMGANVSEYQIRRYKIRVPGETMFPMPEGARLLAVDAPRHEGHLIDLWAKVDPTAAETGRRIIVIGTGIPFPPNAGTYIGNVRDDHLVWHVFDVDPDPQPLAAAQGGFGLADHVDTIPPD